MGSQQPRAGSTLGCCQPGATRRWGRRLGPPQRCCGARFCCRAWAECLKGTELRVLGRAKLSIQTWGLWPLPLLADRSLRHLRQRLRAEPWLQHLLERRQNQLSITSPALTLPAAEGRIQHQAAASGPPDAPQDPHPHRAQACLPCSCLQTLPMPAQPTQSRSGWLLCLVPCQPRSARARRELAGGGFWSERDHSVPSARWAQV